MNARVRPLLGAVARNRAAIAPGAILAIAAISRLLDLGSRALHHDEAIHAITAFERLIFAPYVYEPLFHGPLLYFSGALVFALTAVNEVTARLLPALAGIAVVAAVPYLLRRPLGGSGTLIAMAALTVSSGFLYYSRFMRNDILIALFTLLAFAALYRFFRRPQRRWVLLAGLAFGLSLASKENAYIAGFIFCSYLALLAAFAGLGWAGLIRDRPSLVWARSAFAALFGDRVGLFAGAALILLIPALLFSSFGINWHLVPQAFYDSVSVWVEVHQSGRLNQPWFFYPLILLFFEPFAVVFGLSSIYGWVRRPDLFGSLLIYWLLASLLIYSIAGEKAAWLSLHIALPMILLASRRAGELLRSGRFAAIASGFLLAVLLVMTARHSIAITFLYGDIPRTPMTYSQTSRDLLAVVALIESAGEKSGYGRGLPIHVGPEAHWPLVWYLLDHSAVEYAKGELDPEAVSAPLLIISPATADAVGHRLTEYAGAAVPIRQWFPEQIYQNWTWSSLGEFASDRIHWEALFNFLIWHNPPAPIGNSQIYVYLHNDLLALGLKPAQAFAGAP